MRITYATEPNPGGSNEDLVRVGSNWALVLDGAGRYPNRTGGCIHPVRWVVDQLARHIEEQFSCQPDARLSQLLREAIEQTRIDHGPSCDLDDPLSPGATVAIVRWRESSNLLDWLVLGDCVVTILPSSGTTITIVDDRVDRLPNAPVVDAAVKTYDPEYVATKRNRPDGFWVAGAVPEAADHADTGQITLAGVQVVLLGSDGAMRLTERYGWRWPDVLTLVDQHGPAGLIQEVRAAERADPDPRRWRGKLHDDATAVHLQVR